MGSKKNPRWLWYAWNPDTRKVLAYEFGRRKDSVLKLLLAHLEGYSIKTYFTDDWGAYERLLPKEQHIVGKANTQGIERENLNFRTRLKRLNRKTICFSRSEKVHDKVIGEFINREHFQQL
ncbi:IS1 family transposase [Endozoicomonas arenosclerae]|uniref:IS1 family transposase n=1 Tax=Endozoicomonas arenosclerae TaxID=1633495 RepID=UPI000780F0AA